MFQFFIFLQLQIKQKVLLESDIQLEGFNFQE
jgi:hypothetical protein